MWGGATVPRVVAPGRATASGNATPKHGARVALGAYMGASPHPPVLRLNTRADLLLQKISALEVDLGAIAASTVSMAKIHRQRCKRFFAVSEALQVH